MGNLKLSEIRDMMLDGWHLREKRSYKNRLMSYYLYKRGEKTEPSVSKKTREKLLASGIIDKHDIIIRVIF